jgi:hypothetical protein
MQFCDVSWQLVDFGNYFASNLEITHKISSENSGFTIANQHANKSVLSPDIRIPYSHKLTNFKLQP